MRQPAAVLFDMDGTLVDSEKIWHIGLAELASDSGGQLSPAARKAIVGTAMTRAMQILYQDLGLSGRDATADIAWLESRVSELFAVDGLTWRPGALELLRAVRGAGLPTALVTSTTRRLVEMALNTLGPENFDAVVCGDDVTITKPDPMPYLMAAEALGVPIEACVAIEDSATGVASARSAGAVVIAVPSALDLSPMPGVYMHDTLHSIDIGYLRTLLLA